MNEVDRASSGPRVHAAVCAGDVRDVERALRVLSPDWALAVRGAAYLVQGHAAAPTLAEVAKLRPSEAAELACSYGELQSFLQFDDTALAAWVAAHERLGSERLAFGHLLLGLARGALEGLAQRAADLEASAARQKDAGLTVAAASLRALTLLAQGAHDEAVTQARRASRMARTEGLPIQEYLAHAGLARVRRWQGRASLATRILHALARAAPAPWWGWIAWEQLLAGGIDPSSALLAELSAVEGPAARAALSLGEMLRASASGEREVFERASAALSGSVPSFAEIRHELASLRVLLDPQALGSELPQPLQAWCRGEVHALLPGYPGLCVPMGDDPAGEQSAAAWVVADTARPPRRVPRAALGLLRESDAVAQSRRRSGREDTALAVLALAGGSLAIANLFRAVYGFAYVPELHEGVLRVLIHRLKQRLGAVGAIQWSAGSVKLELARRLVIPDPRCSRAADERVLLALATRGRATARDVAGALGMPLRTVQEAIRVLVDEGACAPKADGRRVEYAVEDTTFSEPTRH